MDAPLSVLQWDRGALEAECDRSATVRAGVEAYLGRSVFGAEGSVVVRVRLSRVEENGRARVVATVTQETNDGRAWGEREVVGDSSCASLDEPLTLVVALLVDTPAPAPEPEPAPNQVTPPPERSAPRTPAEDEPQAEDTGPIETAPSLEHVKAPGHVVLLAFGLLSMGILPSSAAGGAALASVKPRGFWGLSVEAGGWLHAADRARLGLGLARKLAIAGKREHLSAARPHRRRVVERVRQLRGGASARAEPPRARGEKSERLVRSAGRRSARWVARRAPPAAQRRPRSAFTNIARLLRVSLARRRETARFRAQSVVDHRPARPRAAVRIEQRRPPWIQKTTGERTPFSGVDASEASQSAMPRPPAKEAAAFGFPEIFQQHARFLWRTLMNLGVPSREAQDLCRRSDDHRAPPEACPSSMANRCAAGCMAFCARGRLRLPAGARMLGVEIPHGPSCPRAAGAADQVRAEARRSGAPSGSMADARARARWRRQNDVALVLYEVEELTLAEVAEALGVPLQTAYSRIKAARQELRQELTREQQGKLGGAREAG